MKLQDEDSAETCIKINNMCCAMEGKLVEQLLDKSEGVTSFKVVVALKKATVLHNPNQITSKNIVKEIESLKLGPELISTTEKSVRFPSSYGTFAEEEPLLTQSSESQQRELPEWNVSVAVVFLLLSFLQYIPSFECYKYLALISLALCLPAVAEKSFVRLKNFTLEITTLMSLASIGAVLLGDYSEGAAVITLYSLSSFLEKISSSRVMKAIEDVVQLRPTTARIKSPNSTSTADVPVEKINIDDIVEVRDGESFPLDGVLISIKNVAQVVSVDESAFSGEPKPVAKYLNDQVLAGTINVGGSVLTVRVTAKSEDTVVSKMLKVVSEAQGNRSTTEKFVERVAAIYTPVLFALAVGLGIFGLFVGGVQGRMWTKYGLVLLVIGCPCAFVISTPIVYVCGMAQAAREGILIKGGKFLEVLANVKLLALDKTGTLTQGSFSLRESYYGKNFVDRNVLNQIVVEIENGSTHPVAKPLQQLSVEVSKLFFTISGSETLAGEGIKANLVSSIVLVEDHESLNCQSECCLEEKQGTIEEELCESGCCGTPEPISTQEEEEKVEDNCSKGCCGQEEKPVSPSESAKSAASVVTFRVKLFEEVNKEDLQLISSIFLSSLEGFGLETDTFKICQLSVYSLPVHFQDTFIDYEMVQSKLVKAFEAMGFESVVLSIEHSIEVYIGSTAMAQRLDWFSPSSATFKAKAEQFQREGYSVAIIGNINEPLAAFGVGDELKANSGEVLDEVRLKGIDLLMLTGDNQGAATAAASKLHLFSIEFQAGCKPEDKRIALLNAKSKYRQRDTVAMVGDGVNDALCFATADVALAMGKNGTALAVETADVVVMDDDVQKVARALDIGRMSKNKIVQNVGLSIFVKIVVVWITFFVPFPNLWLAIGSDVGAMLVVTLNGISILKG
eukprot:maker-scaffold_4-snap-gene-19.6-mRNA-1 protein AED:0.16 eAED:0.18 QI:0/0/0/1/1/1/2/0/904